MKAALWDTDTLTVYCLGESRLALYERGQDRAWVASEEPLDLREWR